MHVYFRRWSKLALLLLAFGIVGGSLAFYLIESIGPPPRILAPYIERRVLQHNAMIVKTGNWVSRTLMSLDRDEYRIIIPPRLRVGAQSGDSIEPLQTESGQNSILVDSAEMAVQSISKAKPGDVITFTPGTYRFRGPYIEVSRSGSSERRIIVRAEFPGTVILEHETSEGFLVTAPYWTFENLTLRGVCKQHGNCEHAFHVVDNAHHFIARNNTIVDFNSHFKINGAKGKMPDDGIIEGNTLTNTSIRNTGNPVTPIDLVAANRWVIRHNLITDFIKAHSNRISFGAFVKGAGADNQLVQNIVICENLLKGAPGQRVGLSLGGGGTEKSYCRDGRCITEQERGLIESNLIASCSDDGIYVNRSSSSKIFHNTLIDTGGIVVRFPESSADVEGNLVDGSIRGRDDGIVRKIDNMESAMTSMYLGIHPIRNLYAEERGQNFEWSGAPPRRDAASGVPLDLCEEQRSAQPTYGAFERFSACLYKLPGDRS